MQISLKLSRAKKYAKITKCIKFQFLTISSSFSIGASVLPVFPRPVLYLYSKNLETADVNEARKLLFGMNQNMERIPPTCDALLQHTKRSIYQTGKPKYSGTLL